MVQEQLVDYISSQVKLGVSNDAIKAALVGAGWVPQDVDDTFVKINAGTTVVPPARPAAPAVTKPIEPQMIRVSDLVSSSPSSSPSPSSPMATVAPVTAPIMVAPIIRTASPKPMATPATVIQMRGMSAEASTGSKGSGSLMTVVWLILAVIFAGAAGYFFFVNMSLTAKIATAGTQVQGAASLAAQVSSLQAQVSAGNASSTNLAAQVSSVTADDQSARANLSLFVAPAGAPAMASITLSGTITGGKPIYILVTSFGARAYVKNSTDAGAEAVLQPFLGTATTVQLTGTYMPGTPYLTLTAVNGSQIVTPVSAATSTPTQ